MQIFLRQNGEKTGPFTVYDVTEEVRSGRADEDTLGWYQESDGWKPLTELPALETIFVEPPPRAEVARAEELEKLRARLAPERFRSSVRLWARLLDWLLLNLVLLWVVLSSGLMTMHELVGGKNFLVVLVPGAILVVLEAFTISLFGTTPGKWLLRVRIMREGSDAKIPLSLSLYRALTVWWRGAGFYLMPFCIFMMALSQATLLSTGKTPWDRACSLRIEYGKMDRNRVLLVIAIVLAAMTSFNLGFGEQLREVWEASKKK